MIGLFKADVIHRLGPWTSADAIEWETLKWVDWFNNRRLLDPIGYITRAEAEEAVYANMNACRYSRVRRPKQSPVKPGRFTLTFRGEYWSECASDTIWHYHHELIFR